MLSFKKLLGTGLITCLLSTSVFAEVQPTFLTTISSVMTDGIIEGIQDELENKLTPTQTLCLRNTANAKMTEAVNGLLLQVVSPAELQQINVFFATPTGIKFNHLMLENINENEASVDDFTKAEQAEMIAFSKTSAYQKMFQSGKVKKLLDAKSTEHTFQPIVIEKILTCKIV